MTMANVMVVMIHSDGDDDVEDGLGVGDDEVEDVDE